LADPNSEVTPRSNPRNKAEKKKAINSQIRSSKGMSLNVVARSRFVLDETVTFAVEIVYNQPVAGSTAVD
jgi:hypothetical protein